MFRVLEFFVGRMLVCPVWVVSSHCLSYVLSLMNTNEHLLMIHFGVRCKQIIVAKSITLVVTHFLILVLPMPAIHNAHWITIGARRTREHYAQTELPA
jgi:hypothetical protein